MFISFWKGVLMKKQVSFIALLGSIALAHAGGLECDKKQCRKHDEEPAITSATKDIADVAAITKNESCTEKQCRCPHCPHCRKPVTNDVIKGFVAPSMFDMLRNMEKVQQQMQQDIDTLLQPISDELIIQAPKNKSRSTPKAATEQFSVNVDENDSKKLTVTVYFPTGYQQEDFNISITKQNNKEGLLSIVAKKDKSKASNKKDEPVAAASRSISSFQSFNNGKFTKRESSFDSSTGAFEWSMTLGQDISDKNYTMTFNKDKNQFTIELHRNIVEATKKLEFTKRSKTSDKQPKEIDELEEKITD